MTELLLHAKTKKQIQAVLKKPPHAILITGPVGSGKETLARHLAAKLVGIPHERLDQYPYFTFIEKPADKQEISIDTVRRTIHELTLKAVIPSKGLVRRIVLINNAKYLSTEAQNALLKSIEEPPDGTIFILTSPSDTEVLPTITSRVQKLNVIPVSLEAVEGYFQKNYGQKNIDSAWQLSQGCVGLLSALLQDDDGHPLKMAVDSAKKLISMNSYERLLFMDKLSNSREELIITLDALSRVLTALHHSAVKSDNRRLSQRLSAARKMTNSAADSITKNTSLRLICLNLALNLPV